MLEEPQIFILKTNVTLVILLEIAFVLGINKIHQIYRVITYSFKDSVMKSNYPS